MSKLIDPVECKPSCAFCPKQTITTTHLLSGISIATFCAGSEEGQSNKRTAYNLPAVSKKKYEPAVQMSNVQVDRRKSMAVRAVPMAPGGMGSSSSLAPRAQGEVLVALYTFQGASDQELNFSEGDKIELIEEFSDGWAEGRVVGGGAKGLFPLNYTLGKGGRV